MENRDTTTNTADIPVILLDMKTAKNEGPAAMDELAQSNRENERCNDAIAKAISDHTTSVKYGVNFQAQLALEQVLEEFSLDRVAFVVAYQIVNSERALTDASFIDGRYGITSRKWAIGKMTQVPSFPFDNFSRCHFVDRSHPVLVDSLAVKVMLAESQGK